MTHTRADTSLLDPQAITIALPTAAALLAALVGTLYLRHALLRRAMLDRPNERSSHTAPVPRGGGVLFVALSIAWIFGTVVRDRDLPGALVAALALIPVAAIGWVDDARGVRASVRLVIHMACAAAVAWATLGSPMSPTAGTAATAQAIDALAGTGALGWLALAACTVACAWMVNLVNFMDGIDGIAGTEGVFVLVAAVCVAGFAPLAGQPTAALATLLPVAACIAGFTVVNLSPRKIFMGDVGSGTLGLLLAWALLALAVSGALTPWAAAVLPATFVADATVTLIVRLLGGQHPAQAHRTHAYQRLVRRGASHRAITGLYAVVNIAVVLPAALAAQMHPDAGPFVAGGTYAALALLALVAGAGREPAEPASAKP